MRPLDRRSTGRTRPAARAEEDLQALGDGSAPRAGGQLRDAGSSWGSSDGIILAAGTGIVLVSVLGPALPRRRRW
ncbi:MAG: hypothetical protein EA388_05575 [Nitriliruptor sp.]|nr:MAG: hypothetical protein EA388_05575 [Nitriliruptor sp.]